MTSIYFNSWDVFYKSPFGASLVNQSVRFKIKIIDPLIEKVYLVIHKDFGETSRLDLKKIAGPYYEGVYQLEQGKGLYFYHFEMKKKDDPSPLYYGAYRGGEGRITVSREQLWEFQITCYEKEEEMIAWYQEAVFYQIFPDRFFNGNLNGEVNQPKPNTFLYATIEDDPMYIKNEQGDILRWDFFGGNLKGIQSKIPYLKKLGITALYLNPIFEAASNHRYDTADYFSIDPVLGTLADFEALVAELKSNKMALMLDGVFSHVGQNSRYFNRNGAYGQNQGAYQNAESPYVSWFQFLEYPKRYQSWWGIADLPTIDKSNQSFQDFIYGGESSVIGQWTRRGVDAWRLDVADELPDTFIAGIRKELGGYHEKVLIGEVWEDASNKISYQQRRQYILGDHLHGVMNYPLRNAIIALLTNANTPKEVAFMLTTQIENYPKATLYQNLNNLGTHDTERIFSMVGEVEEKLDLAFGLLFFFVGVPCIYYGDEAGLTGGKDPENRKFFPWNRMQTSYFKRCQNWIHLRKSNDVLIKGDIFLCYNSHLFGIVRTLGDDYQALIINPTKSNYQVIEPLVFTTTAPGVAEKIQSAIQNEVLESLSYRIIESIK